MASAGISSRTPVDQLPSTQELPDPFLFVDGSRVTSPQDWPRRREELKKLIQAYEYGTLPPADQVRAEEVPDYMPPPRSGSNADAPAPEAEPIPDYPEGTTVTKYRLTVGPDGDLTKQVSYHLVVTVPPGQGPFPVIVRGDLCWGQVKSPIALELAGRGYLLADFDRCEIVPDENGDRSVGAYAVYPEYDFGALAIWGWGYHRVIDYLLTRGDVDPQKIVVTGHSRGGKSALVAGLLDDRIALVAPNNSGCGGAGCYRHQAAGSETIERITAGFPHWFQPRFTDFIGREDRLPFDQHSVKAAIAPRALLTCEALGDAWANPEGTQVTHTAAKVVYDYLGEGDKIAIHFRPGIHEQNQADWQTLMDFADGLFFGRTSRRTFNQLALPHAPQPWSWTAPR